MYSKTCFFEVYLMTSELHQDSRYSMLIQRNEFLDFFFNILNEVNEGMNSIHSMYSWNMNHKQFKLCVQFLHDLGLLEQNFRRDDSRRESVKITSRGLKFIKDYPRLKSVII